MKEKLRNRSDGVNNYGEDMIEYFSRLINSKDKKITKLIE